MEWRAGWRGGLDGGEGWMEGRAGWPGGEETFLCF